MDGVLKKGFKEIVKTVQSKANPRSLKRFLSKYNLIEKAVIEFKGEENESKKSFSENSSKDKQHESEDLKPSN